MSKLSKIASDILSLLQKSKDGLSIHEIRTRLSGVGVQQHLDRRLRELDPFYEIERVRDGSATIYRLVGQRPQTEWRYAAVSKTVQAAVLNKASGRCQMCGRTISEDAIRLHVDHKIPQSWGGTADADNLWAVCSACNEGKRDYFATFNSDLMKLALGKPSVHARIAALLEQPNHPWIECDLIEFVANFQSFQTDWRRRLRELRERGFEIETRNRRVGKRVLSEYRLAAVSQTRDNPGRRRVAARIGRQDTGDTAKKKKA